MKSVREFSYKEQYNMVLPSITKYRKRYAFIDYKANIFSLIVENTLKSSAENYNGTISEFSKYFENNLKTALEEVTKTQLEKNKLLIISEYIKLHVYKECDFNKFSDFINYYNVILTLEDCIELFETQRNLNFIIPNILQRDKSEIIESGFDLVYSNNLLAMFVEAYAIKKGISLENESDLFDSSELRISSDTAKDYLDMINKIPLLTQEEEKMLGKRSLNGDLEARNKLINHNLRWAAKMAGKYINRGLDYMDVIQEANCGLMKAAEKFDVSKNVRFTTYATWWIRQSILRALSDKSRSRRLPVHIEDEVKKYCRIRNDLSVTLMRTPTLKEMAEVMGISLEKAEHLEMYSLEDVSLNLLVGEKEQAELGDFIPDDNDSIETEYERSTISNHVLDLLKTVKLSAKERNIIMLRYGLNGGTLKTLEEVGKELGITRERVRQLEANALKRLRNSYRTRDLADFMDNPELCRKNIEMFRKYYRNEASNYKDPAVLLETGVLQKMYADEASLNIEDITLSFDDVYIVDDITSEDYIELQDLLKNRKFMILNQIIPRMELEIICFALGFIKNNYYSIHSIAKLYKRNENAILQILRINLAKYKDEIVNLKMKLYPDDLTLKRVLDLKE